jgi:hypothetical protein
MPELDSQDATVSWGPLTAANFDADYELIAWSGSGQVTYFVPEANAAADPEYAAVPQWIQEAQYPLISDFFTWQVAGDNTSSISNHSSWVPQVSLACRELYHSTQSHTHTHSMMHQVDHLLQRS